MDRRQFIAGAAAAPMVAALPLPANAGVAKVVQERIVAVDIESYHPSGQAGMVLQTVDHDGTTYRTRWVPLKDL